MSYKISFLVPITHVELVKNSLFEKGAGKMGNYSCCAWQVLGEGQFMPLENSHAYVGSKNQLTKVSEYYVEMICEDQFIASVVAALKRFHPYEEPAYQVVKLEDF